ncbi:MAG: hypothetical protein JXX14_01995 [Deltaproteobacteria bacterium]|nr:hypothetical protein [Deltaproteobacteria bacterium]
MTIPIILAHGLNGSPAGAKASLLKKHFNAIVPSLGALELPQQTEALLAAMPENQKSILVGSSLGALASLGAVNTAPHKAGYLILLAPAFDLDRHRDTFADALITRPGLMEDAPRYAQLPLPPNIPCEVVQGMEDELFTIDKAIAFVRKSPLATLTLVHDNHQLEKWLPNLIPMIENAIAAIKQS